MPEPQRARNFARAERKFDLMQELQTDLMLICSNISPASLGGIDRAAADFRELGERAAARDLRVGYEALAWGRHVNDYRDAWEIVRRADHPSIGIILDSFHALAPSFPTMPIQSIPADKIFLVQLADAPKLGLDVLSWSRHFRCFPGQGDLAVAPFVEAVLATGYAARCRWKSSTTSFAPAPRSAPPPTGCAPSSCSRTRSAARRRARLPCRCSRRRQPRRRLHRIRRQRRESPRPRGAVRPARFS
jgi:sugar phosphate isomerase/epimerase